VSIHRQDSQKLKPPFDKSLRRNEPTTRQFAGLAAAADEQAELHTVWTGVHLGNRNVGRDPAGRQSCLDIARRSAWKRNDDCMGLLHAHSIYLTTYWPASPKAREHGHRTRVVNHPHHPSLGSVGNQIQHQSILSWSSRVLKVCLKGQDRTGQGKPGQARPRTTISVDRLSDDSLGQSQVPNALGRKG
jgi:hypothetical protein